MPELPEGSRPAAIHHALARFFAHACSHFLIADQKRDRARDIFHVVGLRHQSIDPVLHQFLRTAEIGDDHRKPGCLRFDDDVAERVGRARKNKNVRRCVGLRERFAREISEENRVGQRGRQRL